ncbi:uncharacterized protein C8Q71DRAFT_725991 [Rhodofomes roseus]|uniref:MYND-type domain-containing protein n=1 Tax=Rhodofomes roseus TaxID=34475 RepID=A0ABQ8K7T4_9APHY|nr:uncharacterized protein C8Q71DRAFT_725991 [Rhodofomes roseus]KAH9832861.1 hypothetical protein C8Q71DRAFT_725991 [Rhodofomes roseus]
MSSSQSRVRAADVASVSGKAPSCSSCRLVPKEGEHYLVCKRCKRAAYCSQACQQDDWESHSLPCSDVAYNTERVRTIRVASQSTTTADASPAESRLHLLEHFADAHKRIVQQILPVATHHREGCGTFDYSGEYVVIKLSYRDDCGGDPSRSYRVHSAEFRPQSVTCERYPHLRGRIEQWYGLKAGEYQARKCFLGFVHILWVTDGDDFMVWQALPDYEVSPLQASAMRQADGSDWLAPLRWAAENGFVYRHPRPGFPFPLMGYLKKKGVGWQWQPFSHAQLVAMGSDGVALL